MIGWTTGGRVHQPILTLITIFHKKMSSSLSFVFTWGPNVCEMSFKNNSGSRKGEDNNLILVVGSINRVNQREVVPLACE